MDKKKVVIYEYQKVEGKAYCEKVAIGNGVFHEFGCDFQEFETGAVNYSTAIVELADGSIKNVPVELVVFNN